MHDADGIPSRRCVKNSTLLRSRVEIPRKTILFFHCLLDRGRFTYTNTTHIFSFERSTLHNNRPLFQATADVYRSRQRFRLS